MLNPLQPAPYDRLSETDDAGNSYKHTATRRARHSAWGGLGRCGSLLPAFGILLLPKCPMCFAAYAGIFSYVGLSVAPNLTLLHGLLVAAVAINVGWLAVRLFQHRVRMRLLWGSAAIALLLVGRYLLDSSLLAYAGLAGLVCFVLWTPRCRGTGHPPDHGESGAHDLATD